MAHPFRPAPVLSAVVALALLSTLGACSLAGIGEGTAPSDPPTDELFHGVMPTTKEGLEAEVRRLRAERDRLAQSNLVLEDELHWAHEDLRLAERQFSDFEHRMTKDFGKAAAVTAAAEARIHFDRTQKTMTLPDSTARRVTAQIQTADRLIKGGNYLGALFFAERANHTLQGVERRSSLDIGVSTRLVASASANVRQGPGPHFSIVTTLPPGTRVSCLEASRNWWKIVTTNGSTGWIHASLLR